MKKYKIAVVGFGHIGRKHATIVNEHPDTELTAIIDIDPTVESRDMYPAGVPLYSDLDEFLANDPYETEIINLCTPNGMHASMALKVLDSKRHVVIEKPMALSRAECEEVIFKSLNVGKQVFVVKQNRYSPPSKWLKGLVDSGKLGDIFMVHQNCYWNRDDRYYKPGGWKGTQEQDGGVLFTQFSHYLDIMYWIFGDITNINTTVKDFSHKELTDFVDSGFAQFEFIKGGIGCISFSTSVWNTNMESSLIVIGSKGSIKIGGQYMNEIVYCHVEDYEMPELPPTNPPNDYGPFKGSAANHHYVIENLVDTLNGKDVFTVNAMEGMKVVDIIERIYKAAE